MTLTEYKHYHTYEIYRIDNEDEDECMEYVNTIWEDERTIYDYVELMNDNSSRYQYYYKLA